MAFSVVPLSEVPAGLLQDFLGRVGMTREVAQWRYFDSEFNRGRNRGYAWLPHHRIEGMIGLIPFRVAGNGSARPANWSSDWVLADPSANPGMGIVLLRRAIESSKELFALGGNENTRKLLPRIATRTIPDAGLAFHLLLRSGAVLRRLERRAVLRRLPMPRLLCMIPLRRVRKSGRAPEVRTEAGLARQIAPLLEADAGGGPRPGYDLAYVDWQIGRSPLLHCWTSYGPSQGDPRAAALYWRPRSSSDFWRLVLWHDREYPDHFLPVIREAVSQMYQRGAMAISTLVSHLDLDVARALRSTGFLTGGRGRALYVCTGKNNVEPVLELRGLSYLDSDLGYRF